MDFAVVGAKSTLVSSVGLCLILVTAIMAVEFNFRDVGHELDAVTAVPSASFGAPMPFKSEWSDFCQVVSEFWSKFFWMSAAMLFWSDAFEILDPVVEWIAVNVVNLISLWDRSVLRLPDLFVESANSTAAMDEVRRVIDPLGSVF